MMIYTNSSNDKITLQLLVRNFINIKLFSHFLKKTIIIFRLQLYIYVFAGKFRRRD